MIARGGRQIIGWAAAVVLVGVLAAFAHEPPPERSPDSPMFDRDAMRARLQRRMGEMERELAKMREYLDKLDQGEAAQAVAQMRADARDRVKTLAERRRENAERTGTAPPRRGSSTRFDEPMDEKDQEAMRSTLREIAPKVADLVDRLQEVNPKAAERMWIRMVPRVREAAAAKERDPEGFRLRSEEMRAGLESILRGWELRQAKSRGADAREIEAARARLRDAIATQLDAKVAVQRRELSDLTTKVDALKSTLDAQAKGREQLIQDRVRLIEEAPDLEDVGLGRVRVPEKKIPSEKK